MKLNVEERLTLVRIIPEKGNFETMSTVENLRKLLHLTEEEVDKFEVKQINNQITWNEKGKEPIEIELTTKGKALLISELEKRDKESQLDIHQFQVFKKFKE